MLSVVAGDARCGRKPLAERGAESVNRPLSSYVCDLVSHQHLVRRCPGLLLLELLNGAVIRPPGVIFEDREGFHTQLVLLGPQRQVSGGEPKPPGGEPIRESLVTYVASEEREADPLPGYFTPASCSP